MNNQDLMMNRQDSHYHLLKSTIGAVALAVATLVGNVSFAVFDPATDFEIMLAAYESELLEPTVNASPHSCGDPISELIFHTMPYVRITNTGVNVIDQLAITVGDTNFHFSDSTGLIAGFTMPGFFSDITDFTPSVSNLDGSPAATPAEQDLLTVGFDSGLQPGETAIIRFALAPDDPLMSPTGNLVDYRQVMLGLNGAPASDFTVTGMLGMPGQMDATVSPDPPPGGLDPIGNGRPPGTAAVTEMIPVNTPNPEIPEPASVLLVLLATLGMVGAGRRR